MSAPGAVPGSGEWRGNPERTYKIALIRMSAPWPVFDLQCHSLHSDGELPVAGVVEHAARAGVQLLALTDHDTVDGIEEALGAARAHGIELVPAAEVSSVDGAYEDLHVLGYGIDHRDALLRERLASARERSRAPGGAHGGEVYASWASRSTRPRSMRDCARASRWGAPFICRSAVPSRQRDAPCRGRSRRCGPFLPAYLIPGAPAYSGRTEPTVEQAIQWVHDAGGVAVWAHPSGISTPPRRCSRASIASARRGWMGWSASTSPTTRRRPSCWPIAVRSWGCEHRLR